MGFACCVLTVCGGNSSVLPAASVCVPCQCSDGRNCRTARVAGTLPAELAKTLYDCFACKQGEPCSKPAFTTSE